MRDLVIDRNIWRRGQPDNGPSQLLRTDGKMCCMGIYLEACGFPREKLLEIGYPSVSHSRFPLPQEARWLIYNSSEPQHQDNVNEYRLSKVNDRIKPEHIDITEYEQARESELVKLFKQHDVNITFIN